MSDQKQTAIKEFDSENDTPDFYTKINSISYVFGKQRMSRWLCEYKQENKMNKCNQWINQTHYVCPTCHQPRVDNVIYKKGDVVRCRNCGVRCEMGNELGNQKEKRDE